MTKRRFELGDRFWEIECQNLYVRVAWGQTGKATQRLDREHGDHAAAVAYTDKQIALQLAKGYRETATVEAAAPLAETRRVRLERRDGGTRFVELLLSETRVHYRAGEITEHAIDRVDDRDTAHLPNIAAAHARFDELLAAARERGFSTVDPTTSAVPPRRAPAVSAIAPATFSDLEQQCLDSDHETPWLVLADALEADGDPRGQIAALARAGKAVDRHILAQLRGIGDDDDDDIEEDEVGTADHEVRLVFELAFGFVRHATISLSHEASVTLELAVRRFLASPVARFVDSLRFGLGDYEGQNDWAPVLRAVVESAQAPRIRALAFDAFDSDDSEISWVGYGDFGDLLQRLPRLERLHVKAGADGTLGRLPATLKTFVRQTGGLSREELGQILASPAPPLAHLELWTGSRHYGASCGLADLEPILSARAFPQLRHLGIVDSELVDELIPALARSPLLPQLESLDLSRGVGAADAAASIVAHAPAFRHLAAFDLCANLFSEAQVASIRGALDNVIVDRQRTPHAGDDDRYVEVGE